MVKVDLSGTSAFFDPAELDFAAAAAAHRTLSEKSGAGSGIVGGVLQTFGQCGKLFFQSAHVRALIGHFGKFHGFLLSLFYSFVRDLGTLYLGAKNKTSPKKAGLP